MVNSAQNILPSRDNYHQVKNRTLAFTSSKNKRNPNVAEVYYTIYVKYTFLKHITLFCPQFPTSTHLLNHPYTMVDLRHIHPPTLRLFETINIINKQF